MVDPEMVASPAHAMVRALEVFSLPERQQLAIMPPERFLAMDGHDIVASTSGHEIVPLRSDAGRADGVEVRAVQCRVDTETLGIHGNGSSCRVS